MSYSMWWKSSDSDFNGKLSKNTVYGISAFQVVLPRKSSYHTGWWDSCEGKNQTLHCVLKHL